MKHRIGSLIVQYAPDIDEHVIVIDEDEDMISIPLEEVGNLGEFLMGLFQSREDKKV